MMQSDSAGRARLARAAARLDQGLPTLVLFCDDRRLTNPLETAEKLPPGAMVAVRARDDGARAALALAMAEIARRRGLYLLIAGDGALARRLRCGLHLPEARLGEIACWRTTIPFITVATHSLRALVSAAAFGADAAFLSPVFPTRSHPGAPCLGAARASLIARAVPMPVYALGGIDALTASRLGGFCGVGAIEALRV